MTLFGSIGYVKVVRSVPSPNGEYIAEILDSDQGALGGDTIINNNVTIGANAFITESVEENTIVVFKKSGIEFIKKNK